MGSCGSHTLALRAPGQQRPHFRWGLHGGSTRCCTLSSHTENSFTRSSTGLTGSSCLVVTHSIPKDEAHMQEHQWVQPLSCQMSLHETERGQLKFGVWTMGILKGLEKWATTGPPPPSCVRGYHLLRYFCFRNKEAFMFEAHI